MYRRSREGGLGLAGSGEAGRQGIPDPVASRVAPGDVEQYTQPETYNSGRILMLWSYGVPTINIQADVSVDVLVQAAAQLSAAELRQFTAQMLALSAQRTAPSVPPEETELLLRINSRLPEDVQRCYETLIAKRDAETLGEAEHAELLRLTQQVEAFDVARVEALLKLAALRSVTLSSLMRQLEIASPADV